MAKQVRETSAGKSVSAYVVLNRKGQHVATVNAYFPNGGGCSVDVWNCGQPAVNACWNAAKKCGKLSESGIAKALANCTKNRDWIGDDEHEQWAAFDLFGMQQSSGNDLEGALDGLVIDGQYLFDHCGKDAQTVKLLAKYHKAMHAHPDHAQPTSYLYAKGMQKEWDIKAQKLGAYFSNWSSNTNSYGSLFMQGGLRRLQELGYTVIQAI